MFGEPLPQFVLFLISDVIKGTIKSPWYIDDICHALERIQNI